MPKKKGELSIEERLEQSIVAKEEEPYKLPSNWVWTKAETIFKEISSNNKKIKQKDYLIDGKIPVIDQGKNFIGGYTNETDIESYNEELPVVIFGDHTLNLKYIDFPFVIGADGVKVLKTINSYNPKFLYYCIRNLNLKSLGYRRHFPILKLEKFQFPPLEEQKRIVEKLDSLFEKIQKIKEIIEEVKEKTTSRREAILSKAFSGELTEKWRGENHTENARELLVKINDEKLKLWEDECKKAEDEGRKKPAKPKLKTIDEMLIGAEEEPYKLPSNWVWTRLGDIVDVKGGKRIPKGEEFSKEKTKNIYLRVTDFKNRGIDFENLKFISDEIAEKINNYRISSKDIYLSIAGTIGKVGIIPQKIDNSFLTENACKLTNINNIDQKFLLNLLESSLIKKEIKSSITSSGQPKLAIFRIENFPILLPPLEEQKEIVRVLDKVFEEENRISELISLENKIEILEKTILDRAFRGELGTGNNDDEPAIELLKKCLEER